MTQPLISLVIPTTDETEDLLNLTIAYLRDVLKADFPGRQMQLIIAENHPTIGTAWNAGASEAEGEYLWLGADDVLVSPGAFPAALRAVDEWIWPSPRILRSDHTLHSCGTMGQGGLLGECADRTICHSSPFPIMHRSDWDLIGPSLDIHYYADDYLSWRAQQHLGLEIRVIRDYEITHIGSEPGRPEMVARCRTDQAEFMAAVGRESVTA